MDGHGVRIELRDLRKVFLHNGRELVAVDRLSFTVDPKEFVCILGPSGCGKTTLLRLIAGLESPTSGTILLGGEEITRAGPNRGMVFQEFALFPWRTVRKNVEFGLELKKILPEEKRELSNKYIELVGLRGFEDAHPRELSGGMKQRVGIARALANDPQVLLMDEPFGSLDAQTRNLMQMELLRIRESAKKTVIFVTHSVDESVYLADRIIVMTARPGSVRESIDVPIARPRERTSSEFIDIRARVLELLQEEFEKTRALEKTDLEQHHPKRKVL